MCRRLKCDFCGDVVEDLSKADSVAAPDIAFFNEDGSVGVGLLGDWLACESCSALIMSSEWEMLVSRVLDSMGPMSNDRESDQLREMLRATYYNLWGVCA
jgi:hypothetical protein